MKIRALLKADLEPCALLYCRVFAAPPWSEHWETAWALARLRQVHETPNSLSLVLEDEGTLVGFATGFFEPWLGDIEYYLKEFCIAPERQRQGLGSMLAAELESRARETGARTVYLLTARGDLSEAFYQKMGFYTSDKMIMMIRKLAVAS